MWVRVCGYVYGYRECPSLMQRGAKAQDRQAAASSFRRMRLRSVLQPPLFSRRPCGPIIDGHLLHRPPAIAPARSDSVLRSTRSQSSTRSYPSDSRSVVSITPRRPASAAGEHATPFSRSSTTTCTRESVIEWISQPKSFDVVEVRCISGNEGSLQIEGRRRDNGVWHLYRMLPPD